MFWPQEIDWRSDLQGTPRAVHEETSTRRTRSRLASARRAPCTTCAQSLRRHKNCVWRTLYWGWIKETQERYTRIANDLPLNEVFRIQERPLKKFRGEDNDITFIEADARGVHHPYIDPLVITTMIRNLNMHRTLVNDGSSLDILYL